MEKKLLCVINFLSFKIGEFKQTAQQFTRFCNYKEDTIQNKITQQFNLSSELKLLSMILLFSLASFTQVFAAKRFSVATGDWNSKSTWSARSGGKAGASVPVSGDDVFIERGFTVKVNADAACATISFTNITKASSTISISGTNSLTVSGLITMIRPENTFVHRIIVGAGSLTAGSLTMSATIAPRNDIISISTGMVTIYGKVITGTTGSRFKFTDGGLLKFGGPFSGGRPVLTASTGTVEYTSDSPVIQAFSGAYNNLTFSGTGTTANPSDDLIIKGNLANTGGGTLNFGTRNVTFRGDSSTKSIPGFTTTAEVSLAKTAGEVTFTGNVAVGNLSIASGTVLNLEPGLNFTANTLELGSGGTVSGSWGGVNSGATNINSTFFGSATGELSVAAASCGTITATIYRNSTICKMINTDIKILISGGVGPYNVVYTDGSNMYFKNSYPSNTNIGVKRSVSTTFTLVSVTDLNGCTAIPTNLKGSATVTVYPQPIITPSGPINLCAGESVTLTSSGGIGTTYKWSSGQDTQSIVVTTGAIYTVITNNCLDSPSDPIEVKINTTPTPTIGTITQPSCLLSNGSVDLSGLPENVNWTINPGNITGSAATTTISGLSTGTYNFTVTNDTGCVSAASADVFINAAPTTVEAPVLNNKTLACNQTSFIQDWTAPANVTGYHLDVATDAGFSDFVAGFQDRPLGNVTSETVTGLSPDTTYYVRLRAVNDCGTSIDSNLITVSAPTTTFDGIWSNGLPDSSKKVIFDNVTETLYSDISACSCQINSTAIITVADGVSMKLENDLSVLGIGKLIFENNASLVQINEVANTGNIIYNRISTPMKNYDYTYWSSPVAEQVLNVLSENTMSDKYFSFANDDWAQENGNDIMIPARGYIIRVPAENRYLNGEDVVFPYSQPVQFIGVPNNGHQEFIADSAGSSHLIGNPYPSALDADTFLDANNSVLDGTLYFWTHNTAIAVNTPNPGSGTYAYTSDDYASYNRVGGVATAASSVATGGTNSNKPTGKIAAGQSFFTTSIASGTVNIDNTMRVTAPNTQFFKLTKNAKTAAIEKHRVWLNLTNTQGAFKQTLIGYVAGATNGYDISFDALTFDGNDFIDFYSVNEDNNLVIQGRALPFEDSDAIQLGYSTTIDGAFSIAIDEVDGLLTDQTIYLEDKDSGAIHNLNNGPYSFSTAIGTFNDRFVLRYISGNTAKRTLVTNELDKTNNPVVVSVKNHQIKISSFKEMIDKVFVYELNHRQIYEKEKVNSNEFSIHNLRADNQFLIVEIVLQNGKTVTKKIVF